MNILFFGSTTDSVIILNTLHTLSDHGYTLVCIVTQPPKPVGRSRTITRTPVELWAKEHEISALSFPADPAHPWLYENEQTVVDTLAPFSPDLIISASYGQKIPAETIRAARFGGLNVHPSVLPRWRGADPVPWALLAGDHQTGVTVVTLSDAFDEGVIIAQKKIPVVDTDYADPLRTKLFTIGAALLAEILKTSKGAPLKGQPQKHSDTPYARKFTRDDGFVPWEILADAMTGMNVASTARPKPLSLDTQHITPTITKALRALSPWPGLWSTIQIKNGDQKRLKILKCHGESATNILTLDTVQLEGKQPVPYAQFSAAYLTP